MKELDFDIGITQQAGRALYRSLFIFGSFIAFQRLFTQMSPRAAHWMRFVEGTLWHGSKCYVTMGPRLRLFYSAVICSFVPYVTREFYEHLSPRESEISWPSHLVMGAANGGLIVALCLTSHWPIVLGGSAIGVGHAVLHMATIKGISFQVLRRGEYNTAA